MKQKIKINVLGNKKTPVLCFYTKDRRSFPAVPPFLADDSAHSAGAKKTPRTGNGVQPLWSTERSSRRSAYSQRLPCRSRFLPVFQLPPALCECAGRFTSFSSIYVVLTFGYTLIYHVLFCLSTQIF